MIKKREVSEICGGVMYEGREFANFEKIMDIVFTFHSSITGYSVKGNTMKLYWTDVDDKSYKGFPYEMDSKSAVPFVWGWLQKQWENQTSKSPMGEIPDTDGSVEPGFQVRAGNHFILQYRDSYKPENDDCYVLAKIKPIWIVYGK